MKNIKQIIEKADNAVQGVPCPSTKNLLDFVAQLPLILAVFYIY